MYYEFPVTNDPRQVFTVDMVLNGSMFHAKVEIRYLPAPDPAKGNLTGFKIIMGDVYDQGSADV